MELRIASGSLKNQRIIIPASRTSGLRPTGQRVRNALAQVLRDRISGAQAADFCAGSGSFGFELISHGAEWVDFVEQSRDLAAAIGANARRLKVAGLCRVFCRNIADYIDACDTGYDIIYYDPPYVRADLYAAVPKISGLLAPGGLLLVERRAQKSQESLSDREIPGMQRQCREYGDTVVDIYYRE